MEDTKENLEKVRQAIQKSKPSEEPNPFFIFEKEAYELEERKAFLNGVKQDITERKKYASNIYWLILGWLIIILTIVVLAGLNLLKISDTVLVTLISTTTANVAAFFLGVVRYLFPNNINKKL